MKRHGLLSGIIGVILIAIMALMPIVNAVSHGPAAVVASFEDSLDDHGHSHGDEDDTRYSHDASDHDHPVFMLPVRAAADADVTIAMVLRSEQPEFTGRIPYDLERPPRA